MRMIAAIVALSLGACASQEPTSTDHDPTTVIRSARIFDGDMVLAASTVLLKGDRILSVVDEAVEGELTLTETVEVLECDDCTLLPGLIDAHTHLAFERELQQALAFGVTTELDLYTFLPNELRRRLREDLASGERNDIADFRMATTPVTCPDGLGLMFNPEVPTLADAAGAQAFVDARLAEGADYIKLMYEDGHVWGREIANLTEEELAAAIEAVHARAKLAVTHVTSRHGARAAIAAGSDGLAHIFADLPADADLAARAAEQEIFVIGSLTTLQGAFEGASGAALASDKRFLPFLHATAIETLKQASPTASFEIGSFETALETIRRMHAAGVAVLAGTDVPNAGTAHGISMHRELELLVRAGLTPSEALSAGTSRPAQEFGLEDRGRIAAGLRADLLWVRGDPTSDILSTRDIVAVFRGGSQVDRETLGALVRSSAD